ncbi:MAG: hypothetical protein WCS43_10125, partial [Verrucomicrobiota bacterium]
SIPLLLRQLIPLLLSPLQYLSEQDRYIHVGTPLRIDVRFHQSRRLQAISLTISLLGRLTLQSATVEEYPYFNV